MCWPNSEREPARAQYSPADKSGPVTVEIQRDIFAEEIRKLTYAADKARRIPFIVHQAAHGDFTPFLHEAIAPSSTDTIADGMYLSVTCAEEHTVYRSGGSGEAERR